MRRISTAFPPSPSPHASVPSSVGSGRRGACPTKGDCWGLIESVSLGGLGPGRAGQGRREPGAGLSVGRLAGSCMLAGGGVLLWLEEVCGDGIENVIQIGFGKTAASQLPFVSPL